MLDLSKAIQITVDAVALYMLVESERVAIYFTPAELLAGKSLRTQPSGQLTLSVRLES